MSRIMLMNLEELSKIKNKLKEYLKNKEIIDIILFGSFVKGKESYSDTDIAVISEKQIEIPHFHIININPKEFFINPSRIINTLIKEGFSLKNNKLVAESYGFSSRIMFIYSLAEKSSSEKVKIVNKLRGKGKERGLIEENHGEWLSNNVFIIPIEKESLFERFFLNLKINFKKYNLLMH